MFFTTGPVMIQTIDRHTFLIIQSKMFPVYFVANSIISTIQLALLYQQPQLSSVEYSCVSSVNCVYYVIFLNLYCKSIMYPYLKKIILIQLIFLSVSFYSIAFVTCFSSSTYKVCKQLAY